MGGPPERVCGIGRARSVFDAWDFSLGDAPADRPSTESAYHSYLHFIPRVEVRELSCQVEGPRREEELEDRAFRKEEAIAPDVASVDERTKIGLLQPEHRQRRFPRKEEPPLPVCPHLRLPQRTRHLKTRLFVHASFLCLDCKRPCRFRRRVLRYSLLSPNRPRPRILPVRCDRPSFCPFRRHCRRRPRRSQNDRCFHFPRPIPIQTGHLYFFLQTFSHPPILRRQASLPKTREFASFPHSRVHSCFRHGLLPGPPGSGHPQKSSVASPRNPPRRSTNSTLPFWARVDFAQHSLYLNEPKVYKPASEIVLTSPRLRPSSTLKSSFTTRLSV